MVGCASVTGGCAGAAAGSEPAEPGRRSMGVPYLKSWGMSGCIGRWSRCSKSRSTIRREAGMEPLPRSCMGGTGCPAPPHECGRDK